MRSRRLAVVSLSVMLLGGCGGNESSKNVKNTSKEPEPISMIELSEVDVEFDKCLLKLTSTNSKKHFDIEYINFKRVGSFKTRVVEENDQQHHILFIDERAVALVDEGKRAMTEHKYTNCAYRM